MKKLFMFTLCVIFTISTFAQLPAFVEVTEFEVKDQAKAFELMNTWKEIEKTMVENAPRVFLLSEMDGNTIYFCRAFDTMDESTKYRQSRWGETGWNVKVNEEWRKKVGENPWKGTGVNVIMNHMYRMRMDLSYMPEGTNLTEELPNNLYRRHVNIAVDWGKRSKFIANIKAGIENDKKLNNDYIRLMLQPMYGGEDGADFMMVILGESRASYFTGLEERTKKREVDADWNKIQAEPIATWVSEESLMITY
jgi:hypothetical protein